jgi:hypothetical protein
VLDRRVIFGFAVSRTERTVQPVTDDHDLQGAVAQSYADELCLQRLRPRVNRRLLAGSRILADVVIPAFPTAHWSPAVAACCLPRDCVTRWETLAGAEVWQ